MRLRVAEGGISTIAIALAMLVGVGCHEPKQTRQVLASGVLDTSALDFGDVPVGEWRSAKVKVRNVGYVPFSALEVVRFADNPSFIVELDDGKVFPGEEREIQVRFHPLEEGELTENFHVATDADDKPQDRVTLRGVGTPAPIRVEPSELDFETLELDDNRTLEFTVTNPVDIPLTVTLNGEKSDPFSPDVVTIPPLSTQVVRTRYFPRVEGQYEGLVQIRACEKCTPSNTKLVGKAVPYAFQFEPSPVPFQDVPVHESTRSTTKMTNVTWRRVAVTETPTSDQAFTPITRLVGTIFRPGESMEVELEFAARTSGPAVGEMQVKYLSDKDRQAPVVLDARGGRPTLALTPITIDFGEVPVGAKVEKIIRMTNAGTQGSLYFQGIRGDGADATQFSVSTPFRGNPKTPTATYPWTTDSSWPQLDAMQPVAIAPGADAVDLKAFFNPDKPGEFRATFVFRSDDMFFPERTVTVTGRARESGPCQFALKPASAIDFGAVWVNRGAVLGFFFENTGTTECAVKDIHLSNDAGGVFFMPGGQLAGGSIPWATAFSAQIAFRSPNAGAFEGELSITVNNPNTPVIKLPLKAIAQASCLVATPSYLDFGPIRTDCAPTPRRAMISNICDVPVTVDTVNIGEGTSDQYSITGMPPLPQVLQPAQGFEVQVSYARTVFGQHFSPLYVKAQNESAPLLVPLVAETNRPGYNVDRFTQGTDNQLDVLFVISNTTTMTPYQDRLQASISNWLSRAASRGVDLKVGVTSTGLVSRSATCGGGANGGENGRLFPVDGSRARVVSSTMGNAASLLQQNLEVGVCHNLEQGLEAMRSALSTPLIDRQDDPRTPQPNDGNLGLLRTQARLAVVFLSDEDDHSGFDPESYVQFLQSIKGTNMGHRVTANAMVPMLGSSCTTAGPAGSRFTSVASRTAGQSLSICDQDYTSFLDSITSRAAGPQREFRLVSPPSNPSALTVKVNGQVKANGTWWYDAAKQSIVFDTANTPAAGQQITVEYQAVCTGP